VRGYPLRSEDSASRLTFRSVTPPEASDAPTLLRSVANPRRSGQRLRDGLAVVIADVCGKGISAALLASILQGMIYSQLCNNLPLAEVVATVNQFLCQKNLDAKYATLVLVRLAANGTLEYVNCGHVPPLLVRQPDRISASTFLQFPASMLLKLLKSKIHNATVTYTDVNYHGSITIDSELLRASGLLPNEAVIVADSENGNRFETYVIAGERGSGTIGINGAAARLSKVGNRVIIMSFVMATPPQAAEHRSRVVIVDRQNRALQTIDHSSSLERPLE